MKAYNFIINSLFFAFIILVNMGNIVIAQEWIHSGPFGCNAKSVAVARYDSSIVFAGLIRGGFYKMSLEDRVWISCNDNFPTDSSEVLNPDADIWQGSYSSVNCIVSSPLIEEKIWVGTKRSGLWMSDDEGETWYAPNEGLPQNANVYKIVVHESNPNLVTSLVIGPAHLRYLYHSNDSGLTWQDAITTRGNGLLSMPDDHDHLLTVELESFDGGETWQEKDWDVLGELLVDIAVNPDDSLDFYGVVNYWGIEECYISRLEIHDGIYYWCPPLFRLDDVVNYLHVDRSGIVYFDNIKFWVEFQYGQPFPWISAFQGIDQIRELILRSISSLNIDSEIAIWAGSHGIPFTENAGQTAEWIHDGIDNESISVIVLDNISPSIIYTLGSCGLYKTINSGREWSVLSTGSLRHIAISHLNPLILYALNPFHRNLNEIDWRSEDGGETWEQWTGLPHGWITTHPTSDDTLWNYSFASSQLYLSADAGETWELVWQYNYPTYSFAMNDFDVDPLRPNRIYGCGWNIVRSFNYGETSEYRTVPGTARSLVCGFDNPDLLYYCSLDNVYRSEDAGNTWEAVGDNIPHIYDEPFVQLERSPYGEEALYLVAQDRGVYHWLGPGQEWELLEGPYGWRVNCIAVGADSSLAIGTRDKGVWVYRSQLQPPPPPPDSLTIPLQGRYFELISTNRTPDDLDAAAVFGDVENLEIVYQDDGSIYIPPPLGINTIGDIDVREGYQIFCSLASQLTFTGTPLDPATEYTLAARRWNFLGFPFQEPVSIEIALQEIAGQVIIILTDDGRLWIPELGINTIGEMVPREGYYTFVSEDVTFQYSD